MSERADSRPRGGFCPDCGRALSFEVEPAECTACGYRRVRWPRVGVSVVIRDEQGRVLMGRRAFGAFAGRWCIPCGVLEWGEDVRAGAIRELREEAGLEVTAESVLAVHSNFHFAEDSSVGVWFRGRVTGGQLHCADGEMTELGYFAPGAPPELAFPTDAVVLRELAAGRD